MQVVEVYVFTPMPFCNYLWAVEISTWDMDLTEPGPY